MTKQRCILYVEDDEIEVMLTRHAFKATGISHLLHVVADGPKAISHLAGADPHEGSVGNVIPWLVLLDLNPPGMSGFGVLQWIRAHLVLKSLVVILFTSSRDRRDVAHACELRVDSFVNKPLELGKRLEFSRLLKGWWLEFNLAPDMCEANFPAGAVGFCSL